MPGSLGNFKYYTTAAGPYAGLSTEATTSIDSAILLDMFAAKVTENTAYALSKSDYDGDASSYNSAITTEKARQADIIKLLFEAYAVVPERPCPPSQPSVYAGPRIDWWVSANAIATINDTTIALGYGTLDNMALTSLTSLNAGYVQATPDTSATAISVAWSGHTFGLQGQGIATMPADGIAFSIVTPIATTTHGVMISIFPYVGTWTGLTGVQAITVTASAVTWRTHYSIDRPDQPGAATSPDASGASALAATGAAAAAIMMALY
jgi:hypothetical protein